MEWIISSSIPMNFFAVDVASIRPWFSPPGVFRKVFFVGSIFYSSMDTFRQATCYPKKVTLFPAVVMFLHSRYIQKLLNKLESDVIKTSPKLQSSEKLIS